MIRRSRLAAFRSLGTVLVALTFLVSPALVEAQECKCNRTISADVVALDQAFYNNRLGSFQAGGMIFAL